MDFRKKLDKFIPLKEEVTLMWIGQAGFMVKNSQGKVMAIDLYLSDLVERLDGNKRLTPALIDAEEVKADVILASHCHADHLDLDSLPDMLSQNAQLYCCEESYELCKEANLPMHKITSMKIGDKQECSGFQIEAVFADHGDTAPKAIGYLIETDGISIYYTGDTAYQSDRMSYVTKKDIDILILPINGEYVNMNERDAAMLAAQTKAQITIPCHFWTFARHQGSPHDFQMEMNYVAPDLHSYIMAQGECIIYSKNKRNGEIL